MIKKLAIVVAVAGFAAAAHAQVVASDDYETGSIGYGYNGGFGYGALTYVEGSPGGVFGMNSGTGNRQIDGNQSLGIFSGGGSQAAGRSLTSPVGVGDFSI